MRNWPFKVEQPGAKLGTDCRRYVVARRNQWGTKEFLHESGRFGYHPVLARRLSAEEADALAVDGAWKEIAP